MIVSCDPPRSPKEGEHAEEHARKKDGGVDVEFELSSASSKCGEDECSEWATVVSKTGTKRKLSKIEVNDKCVNDNISLLGGMRLLSKDTYVGNPFENCIASSAVDFRTGTKVAIKKLHRPFQSELFAKRAYRELRLLKHMKHDNVIGLVDVFTADLSLDRFHDFYLVMPFMGTDLGKLMKLQQLSEDKVQFLVYQMLKGLKYIHSAGIIHRDLKPGNLSVNQECELKILDFGLARQADSEMTGYVVTRWYRAPEVILSWMHYTQTVDIWSVGCIMAEMLSGKPLFKGNDHLDQLTEIMKITGTPTQEFITKLQSQDAKNYVKRLPKVQKKDLQAIFSKVNPQAVTVIERMLLLDPESRVTAAEALALPYFSEFREPDEETEAQPYDHSVDNSDLPLEQWKRHTFTEILSFQPIVVESRETAL